MPAGFMKMKRKEFLALKQGAMSVTEYRDKFLQLARYAPADVAEDSDKQEQFMEGLNDGLQMQLLNHTFNNFNHLVAGCCSLRGSVVRWRRGREGSTPLP